VLAYVLLIGFFILIFMPEEAMVGYFIVWIIIIFVLHAFILSDALIIYGHKNKKSGAYIPYLILNVSVKIGSITFRTNIFRTDFSYRYFSYKHLSYGTFRTTHFSYDTFRTNIFRTNFSYGLFVRYFSYKYFRGLGPFFDPWYEVPVRKVCTKNNCTKITCTKSSYEKYSYEKYLYEKYRTKSLYEK
jgi:hypothetical protein